MRKLLSLLITTSFFFTVHAQNAYFDGLSIMDGSGTLRPSDMIVDHEGNVIIIGNSFDRVDLDPGLDSAIFDVAYPGNLYMPLFILKLDSAGNHLWSGIIPGVDHRTEELQIDLEGNVFIAGMFGDTLDFDISDTGVSIRHAIAPYDDAFLLKLNPDGEFQWVKTFGGSGSLSVRDIAVDHSGNILFTGPAEGNNLVFHPNTTSPTYNAYTTSYYTLKYDSTGAFMWVKQFGSFFTDYDCEQVEVTSNNDVIISGEFTGTVDFDPGPGVSNLTSTLGSDDVFIMKLDSAGTFQWAKSFGNGWNNRIFDMKISSSDKLHFTGELRDSMDFDPGSGSHYEKSKLWFTTFILKLDANSGSFAWVESFFLSDPANVEFHNLHIDHEGGVYTTGEFKREFYVHPDTSVNNYSLPSSTQSTKIYRDAFIHKFDSSGTYMWAHSIHSNEYQRGKAVASSTSGKVLLAGEFTSTVDFGLGGPAVNITADGGFDMFVLEMGQCIPSYTSISDSTCDLFVTPHGDTLSQSGQYQYSLPGSLGCDSIIDLDLKIIEVDNKVIVDPMSGDLTAQATGATYRWLDCDSNYFPISGANSYLYKPIVNGNYAVEVTTNFGCVDTSECISVNFVGLSEQNDNPIRIYPNPSDGIVNIDLGDVSGLVSVELFDAAGHLLYFNERMYSEPFSINLPGNFAVYELRVILEGKEYSRRILRQ